MGKFVVLVPPTTCSTPAESTVEPTANSLPVPPRKVEYESVVPVPLSLVTHTSYEPPPYVAWYADTTGKLVEAVRPTTYASPCASTEMENSWSPSAPPR